MGLSGLSNQARRDIQEAATDFLSSFIDGGVAGLRRLSVNPGDGQTVRVYDEATETYSDYRWEKNISDPDDGDVTIAITSQVFGRWKKKLSDGAFDVAADLAAHEADLANPHAVTAAQTGAYTTAQVDALIDPTLKAPTPYDPTITGNYPATAQQGDTFRITAAGTMGAIIVNVEDLLISLIDNPGQVDANWQAVESNRDQATEIVKGVAAIATVAEVDAATDDTKIITALKLAGSALQTKVNGIEPGAKDDQDSSEVPYTGAVPTNYTPGSADVEGHLEGIDTEIGNVYSQIGIPILRHPTLLTLTRTEH
jgi:hypothetical protein